MLDHNYTLQVFKKFPLEETVLVLSSVALYKSAGHIL
jgi:hypothetical protein